MEGMMDERLDALLEDVNDALKEVQGDHEGLMQDLEALESLDTVDKPHAHSDKEHHKDGDGGNEGDDDDEDESNERPRVQDMRKRLEKNNSKLLEVLSLIGNVLQNEPVQGKLGTRLSMLEEIDRLKEEIATLQEEKENAEEKVHSQGLKIRRLMEEGMQRKEPKDTGGRDSPSALSRSESLGSIESEDGDPAERLTGLLQRADSSITAIFAQEELHDDFYTRWRTKDTLLTEYLARPSVLASLIDSLVLFGEYDRRDRIDESGELLPVPAIPFTASEILTSNVPAIEDSVTKPESLKRLFTLLDRPPPLPSSPVADLWYKVMAHLLARKSKELSLYIKQNDVLVRVVNHIDTECVFNLLLTMLNTEATLESEGEEFQWSHLQLIDAMAEKLDNCGITEASDIDWPHGFHSVALDHISEFLCEILLKYPYSSPLVMQMQERVFVKRLIRNCFVVYDLPLLDEHHLKGPAHCLTVLNNLLTLVGNPDSYTSAPLPPVLAEFFDDKDPFKSPLVSITALLKDYLLHSKTQRIGDYRLKLLATGIGLGKSNYFWIDYAMLSTGLIEVILNFYFALPLNNIVHHMIGEFLQSVFQSNPARADFCIVILKDLKFAERLVEIPGTNRMLVGPTIHIVTAIQRAALSSPTIASFLTSIEGWQQLIQDNSDIIEQMQQWRMQ